MSMQLHTHGPPRRVRGVFKDAKPCGVRLDPEKRAARLDDAHPEQGVVHPDQR
ncbi:hypothetical protein [Microbacterium sp. W4I20]|uniref:hypothetical protein n=1 Tax=Microbacterium sp. W4I20 TaxID=3042262 RepID=UPI002784E916|nr:hypothetical protein [Microbacterium sp. W4I20]MDQ0726719.1 hypothetical protein [Microbacterium sp. W4I20]